MKDNYDHITTSQAIFDVVKRGNYVEETRIQYEIKCIGTEIETAQMGKDTVKYKFTITKIDLLTDTKKSHEFVRRYTHFLWLQNELQNKQIGRVIPSLPEKQTVYDKDKRKLEFVYFMQKILSHKKLQQIDCLERFFSEELRDYDAFQHYIENMKESQSMFNMVINTGISVMNMFSKFYNYNAVQIINRIPDENDKQFEEFKKELEQNKSNTEIITSDIQKIVQKLQIQARSLSNSFDIFMNECQGVEEFTTLKTIIKIYESYEIKLRQKYVYRMEASIKDYDQAIKLINLYKELKEQINKDTQLINNPNYRSQIDELKMQINNNKQKVEQLHINFLDDIDLFKQQQSWCLNDVQKKFYIDLQECYDSIKQQKTAQHL
ncbi:unnamed protein product [Paramecium pentaurelia]|uniref:PX domain-containing protein n=1 Tax=Paramecium pentaurelia TaxID=43138 RepID=A0A8S1W9B9_9CILI|nr:unnamed protein product [Paramecium pentaurelia]